jgi:cobalt-precorrin-5B (C1)-methyltransferase
LDSRKPLREGFTTGACAAAAAKAAARLLVRGLDRLTAIETMLPNGRQATFALRRCERVGDIATCSVVKDAGDDPDCTNQAELTAQVELAVEPGIVIRGGEGVATVTKPGLGLEVGSWAINPVPHKNITQMVLEELTGSRYGGAAVTISVPGGAEMAKQTINARLGLVGGISILGTTGIVRPYSTAAWLASVEQAINVAAAMGSRSVALTTGGRTEHAAMRLLDDLPEEAFIQMGDFVGAAVRHAATKGLGRAMVVGMIGKLAKIAAGRMQTHARQGEVDLEFLATLAAQCKAPAQLVDEIRAANTARHVGELCREYRFPTLLEAICRHAAQQLTAQVQDRLEIWIYLVDFDGGLLAYYPEVAKGPS